MGAFTDLFKSKDRRHKHNTPSTTSPSRDSHLARPLWALATEPTPRPARPIAGPRSPSKRSVLPLDAEEHQTSSRLREIEEEAARARALQGRQAGERVRESLLSKRRRRTASLEELSRGLKGVSLGAEGRSPPKGVQRVQMHARTMSTPRDVFRSHPQQQQGPPAPSTGTRALPPSPPKPRPGPPSSSPTRPSPYAQALPTPPRPPPHSHSFPSSSPAPAPQLRGPNPIRQIAPSAPSTAPQSRNTSGGSVWGQMLPGAFPRDGEQGGWTMPEPKPWNGGGGGGVQQQVQNDDGDVFFLRYPPQQQQPTYYPHPPSQPAFGAPPPPPPPLLTRPPPRPMSSSLSAPHLSTTTLSTPPRRKPPSQTQVIDLPDSPPRSSTAATKNQCHGTTGTGKRCTRSVASTPGSTPCKSAGKGGGGGGAMDQLEEMLGASDDADGGGVVRFCFQHAKQAMGEKGCFVSPREGRSKWVEFDDWILPDLPMQTKILLRHEMAMPVSPKDEEGYIYVHEMIPLVPTSSSPTTHLKLGRSIHPITRLSQWRSQCPSREPIVRGIFPLHPSSSVGGVGGAGALRVKERGTRNHHRWERLVLIEVAGRAEVDLGGGGGRGERKVCSDCGRAHLELFEVREGAFDEWVAEVVERWGRWCADVLG